MNRLSKLLAGSALAAALIFSGNVFAQATKDTKGKTAPAAAASSAPSDKDIADAKAKGLVWVNTSSKIYHKDGEFYGKTKRGEFMTEADAQKAGNRAAKASAVGKKKTTDKK